VIDPAILAAIHARLDRALAVPAASYRPFVVGDVAYGLLDDARAARLARLPRVFRVDERCVALVDALNDCPSRSAALADVAATLRAEGALPAWRDERYAVAVAFDAPVTFHLERGAARYFGVRTFAAHVNGLVGGPRPAKMWLARRSPAKAVDPGLLDNLVGGGIGAGFSVEATVIKEAWEEAGIVESLARRAQPAGVVFVRRPMFDGLQRETIFAHDLALPADFVPANQDGEAVEHRLVSFTEAASAIAHSDGSEVVTIDASVVVLDCLLRHGAIARDAPQRPLLAALRTRWAESAT
jgi:8-oxo-dGTP pyrophosphatase MutT (NUDIX family)